MLEPTSHSLVPRPLCGMYHSCIEPIVHVHAESNLLAFYKLHMLLCDLK